MRQLVERSRKQEAALRAKFDKATGSARRQAREQFFEFEEKRKKELDRRRDALQRALVRLATTAAKAVAEEKGVTLVLERSAVLVYGESFDVTEQVIARVNAVKLGGGS